MLMCVLPVMVAFDFMNRAGLLDIQSLKFVVSCQSIYAHGSTSCQHRGPGASPASDVACGRAPTLISWGGSTEGGLI